MDTGKHLFLRREIVVHHLSPHALDRIISRGLGQNARREISYRPILPLINSEAHILCSDVDVSSREVAFGRLAIPKLKKEILSSDKLKAKRAILSLLDIVHDPERAVEAIRLKVIPRLVRPIMSEDLFVRQNVLMILEVLAMQPDGKMAIVKHEALMKNLLILLGDESSMIRLSAVKAMKALATWYFGVNEMITQYFIPGIINRLNIELEDDITKGEQAHLNSRNTKKNTEVKFSTLLGSLSRHKRTPRRNTENLTSVFLLGVSTIQKHLLEILELLVDQDPAAKQQGLDNGGVELAVLLEHPDSGIRSRAAAVLSQLTRIHSGKLAVLNHRTDILVTLIGLLDDSDVWVKTHAAGTLMYVMCTTEAKLRSLSLGAAPKLLQCAQFYTQPGLQINAVKALTSFAESQSGQRWLKDHLQEIQDLRPADNIVERHRIILISIINRVI